MRIARRLRTGPGRAVTLAVTLPLLAAGSGASADDREAGIALTVDAGRFDRRDTPVQISIPTAELPPEAADRLGRIADQGGRLALREVDGEDEVIAAQVDRPEGDPDRLRILWVLPGETAAGAGRIFREEVGADESRAPVGPWGFGRSAEGHLELSHGTGPVFRYNTSPVSHPDHPNPNQPRDAYIHPAFTPSGAMITGDYSADSHPHHRGFFLAYTSTEVDGLKPDFWNIQAGSGKVHFERLGEAKAGPVSARFSAFHRWEATRPEGDPVPVLRERWDVEAIGVPGSPYWLIDLTASQQAVDAPLVLPPYRYGGIAYRGPDSFAPRGVLDVLTSEGFDRVAGDQEPARWVDLTGPIADESDSYAGAAMFDHPENLNHPTPARIHPTRLPFFCFVPSHDAAVSIGPDEPTVFRYRILIHDGRPDAELNERLWRDFAEPPEVTLAPAGD